MEEPVQQADPRTLRKRLEQGALGARESLRLLRTIAEELGKDHAQDQRHGDLRPEHVVLRNGASQVELRAGELDPDDLRTLLAEGHWTLPSGEPLVGKLRYWAPEQRDPQGEVDARSDLHALGVVLFEMLTGEAPSGLELPSEVVPGLDTRFDEIYGRLCAPVEQRFASAKELLDALGTFKESPPLEGMHPEERVGLHCVQVVAGPLWRGLALAVDLFPFLYLLSDPFGLGWGGQLGAVALFLLYDILTTAAWGRTLGKWLFGLRVLREDGERSSFSQGAQRGVFRVLSMLCLGLGYLPLLRWPERKAYHDSAADTQVYHIR